jgi:hypothetical protein
MLNFNNHNVRKGWKDHPEMSSLRKQGSMNELLQSDNLDSSRRPGQE